MDISVTPNGQMDILYGTEDMLTQVSRGALRSEVIEAAYGVMDRRFNRLMDTRNKSGESKIRHMYEWESAPGNPAHRLWYTKLIDGDQVAFFFRQSTQQVPIDPRLDKVRSTDHVFRDKARVFENAEQVEIRPTNMVFLRWYDADDRPYKHGSSLVEFRNRKKNTVHSLGSDIYRSGGGAFDNAFTNEFSMFWATAGVSATADLSRVLNGSQHFRKAIKNSEHRGQTIKSLKKMRGTQRAILSNGRNGPVAKKAAKEMLAAIKQELKIYGATG